MEAAQSQRNKWNQLPTIDRMQTLNRSSEDQNQISKKWSKPIHIQYVYPVTEEHNKNTKMPKLETEKPDSKRKFQNLQQSNNQTVPCQEEDNQKISWDEE